MQGTRTVLALLAVATLAATTNAAGQQAPVRTVRDTLGADQVQSAADELAHIQRQMRALRTAALEREQVERQTLRELSGRKRGLERTLEAIQKQIDRRQQKVDEQSAKITEARSAITGFDAEQAKLTMQLLDYCGEVRKHIENSIPWRRESRLHSVEKTVELLESKNATAAAGVAAVTRIQTDEEALGRLVEPNTMEIQLDGDKTVAVKGFHLGLLAVIYANKDSSVVGYCKPGDSLADGLVAVRGRPGSADGYLRAIDILEKRRTPTLVDIYLSAFPTLEGNKR